MVIWFIVGLSIVCAWIWGLLFMASVSKGVHRTSRHEKRLPSRYMVNAQNINDSIKEVKKRASLVPHC